jgi:hypothetical protein
MIKFDTIIPLAHQSNYKLNPNYATIIKQIIDKLLTVGFIKLVEEATCLSLIMVVPKKNGKLKICVDFKKLNTTTRNNLYRLPFTNEVINIIVACEVYTFLDEFLGYHQISITPENQHKTTFVTN